MVMLNGRANYLGRHGTPESKERYDRLVAQWLAAGRKAPIQPGDGININELCAAFWRHAGQHYRKKDGTSTTRLGIVGDVIRTLRRVYGSVRAAEFGPRSLVALRQVWVDGRHRAIDAVDGHDKPVRPLARVTVNDYTSQAKLVFKYGVQAELVPSSVYEALCTVPGLSAGRSEARETEPVRPVPEAHINAIEQHVSRQAWAMVRIQLLTGARGEELVNMRPVDIDTAGKIWLYQPTVHKTAHHGKERTIFIGPKAQEIIKPFLKGRAVNDYLFDPREAVSELKAREANGNRRSNQKPSPRKSDRVVRDRYDSDTYRRAIERACDQAGVPRWTPHRLRHSAATHIRREFGLEAAQLLLGHARADVTQIYAEKNQELAMQIAGKIG